MPELFAIPKGDIKPNNTPGIRKASQYLCDPWFSLRTLWLIKTSNVECMLYSQEVKSL